ncbi:hypothetical protein [Rhizobium leguminosarum]|uniref:hypothetical protein n=1 Tax=Rhizobium leguminosarum TaxID=384 RepID=UPI001C90CEDF|nr:hypothetical protein [Rhizobium leguminosarum]MBY2919143.1 hypothetical protein [Rhizobium leguminosarum]MBY2923831.1 hypothetical protein [Rhizobium leguminosarum]MBY2946956.1 hypothetical protein [Rhizobium leguminosarum]MBY2974792.1 hypothetical protein [Rhizobium leguminosarum]MBY2982273.1 hypothetical protein [Rhizobium leguminosarum]
MSKITEGLNDRPKDSTIAQSGPGLPDDSGQPIEATDQEVERVREKFKGDARRKLQAEIDEQVEKPQRGTA